MKHSYLIMLGVLVVLLVVTFVFLPKGPKELGDFVPEAMDNLYLDSPTDPGREAVLKQQLAADEVLSVTYGIKTLQNSKVRLELFRYNPATFPLWLSEHLGGSNITIGGEEIELPCETITIKSTEVKRCSYSSESVNVVKDTFALKPNIIARVLCSEGFLASAQSHCDSVSAGVISKG